MTLTPAETSALAVEPSLIRIPAAWFLMGSTAGQDCEGPIHRVWVDAFLLAATQVTNVEYARFLSATGAPRLPFWQDPNFNHPDNRDLSLMVRSDALLRVAQRANRPLLPLADRRRMGTCRPRWAGTEKFPLGRRPAAITSRLRHALQSGPETVARYAPNTFGLYDICDNVHEWCSDWYDPNYYAISPERNPRGPEPTQRKSSRGGSWRHHIKVARCSARSSIPPDFHYADYGFRVACAM